MSELISCSICLTDIPKDKIKVAENGKKYLNIQVAKRREPDRYENTHTIYVSQTKEERALGETKSYIGFGKVFNPKPVASTPEEIDSLPTASDMDALPF